MKKLNEKKKRELRFQISIEVIMIGLLILIFVPVFLMLTMSVKTNAEIYSDFFALPKNFQWENYKLAFKSLAGNMVNTLYMDAIAVVLTLVVSAIGGYVFGVMDFPGKNLLYSSLLVTMMIPGVLSLAANYRLTIEYGLLNTRWAVILPWVTGGQILGIILCRNSIESLPKELFEAARIEGCGDIRMLVHICIPLIKPILSTIAIMKVVDYYNDFIWPLLVIESNTKQVITVALKLFTSGRSVTDIGVMFAGYVIATIPLFILFMFTSRLYMEGLTAGAVKG